MFDWVTCRACSFLNWWRNITMTCLISSYYKEEAYILTSTAEPISITCLIFHENAVLPDPAPTLPRILVYKLWSKLKAYSSFRVEYEARNAIYRLSWVESIRRRCWWERRRSAGSLTTDRGHNEAIELRIDREDVDNHFEWLSSLLSILLRNKGFEGVYWWWTRAENP